MLHICQRISFGFSATQKYVLKNFKYLIQAPPKRPPNGWNLFLKEKIQGKLGQDKSNYKFSSEIGTMWKNMKPEEKAPYQNRYKSQFDVYKKKRAQYDSKYVAPFKLVSPTSLFLQHLYKDNVIQLIQKTPLQVHAKEISKNIKAKTPEQTAKYQELANKIRQEKLKISSAFAFPERLYNSKIGFLRKNPTLNEVERKAGYQAYEQKWKLDVKKWLEDNKIGMTIQQFVRLYNRKLNKKRKTLRAKRQEAQSSESEFSSEGKKVAKKALRPTRVQRAIKASK